MVWIGIIEKRSKLRKINGTRFVGFWRGITRFGILAGCSGSGRRRSMVHSSMVQWFTCRPALYNRITQQGTAKPRYKHTAGNLTPNHGGRAGDPLSLNWEGFIHGPRSSIAWFTPQWTMNQWIMGDMMQHGGDPWTMDHDAGGRRSMAQGGGNGWTRDSGEARGWGGAFATPGAGGGGPPPPRSVTQTTLFSYFPYNREPWTSCHHPVILP